MITDAMRRYVQLVTSGFGSKPILDVLLGAKVLKTEPLTPTTTEPRQTTLFLYRPSTASKRATTAKCSRIRKGVSTATDLMV